MRFVRRGAFVWVLAAAGVGLLLLWQILAPRKVEHPIVASAPDGRSLFEAHCAACHGPAGKGDGPGAKVIRQPMLDFTDAPAMAKLEDGFLAEIIQKGGSQFGRSNAMPAWGMKLSEEEIRALVVYIRSLARHGSPVSSASQ